MEALKKQLRFQYTDAKKSFLTFWGIVLAVDILGIMINYFLTKGVLGIIESNGRFNLTSGNSVASGIFIIVTCIVMYSESFPAAMEFSSTRKDFYKGALVFYIGLSIGMALVQTIIVKIEAIIIPLIGGRLYENYLLTITDYSNIFEVFLINTFSLLATAAVFNLVGILFHKYGAWAWLILGIFVTLFGPISVFAPIFAPLIVTTGRIFEFNLGGYYYAYYILAIAISVILFSVGWLFIRNIDLKRAN